MREKRSGINYEFSWNPFPHKFFSMRYYDHIEDIGFSPEPETLNLDFPTIDSNAIITHWGFTMGDLTGGVFVEDVFNSIELYRVTLIINQGRVFGYSGKEYPVSTFLMPGGNMSLTIGSIHNLCPLSYPITQDGSTVRVEFINNGIPFVNGGRFYARVRGIYAIAS